MKAVFFFTAHEKGFKFHAQPQTGAYSCFSKLLPSLVNLQFSDIFEENLIENLKN